MKLLILKTYGDKEQYSIKDLVARKLRLSIIKQKQRGKKTIKIKNKMYRLVDIEITNKKGAFQHSEEKIKQMSLI